MNKKEILKEFDELIPEMQVSTQVEPRLLNADMVKRFISQSLDRIEAEVYERGRRDGTAKESERHESMNDLAHDMKSKLDDIESVKAETRKQLIDEVVEKYGDYRIDQSNKKGRTLRFYLLPHTEHKPGDDHE